MAQISSRHARSHVSAAFSATLLSLLVFCIAYFKNDVPSGAVVWLSEEKSHDAAWVQLAQKPTIGDETVRDLNSSMLWVDSLKTKDQTLGI